MTTPTQPTELQLQLWLAKQLPEELVIIDWRDSSCRCLIAWKGSGQVTPREWDYIVRLVEERLTDQQWHMYSVLAGMSMWISGWDGWHDTKILLQLTWQQKTELLSATTESPIK